MFDFLSSGNERRVEGGRTFEVSGDFLAFLQKAKRGFTRLRLYLGVKRPENRFQFFYVAFCFLEMCLKPLLQGLAGGKLCQLRYGLDKLLFCVISVGQFLQELRWTPKTGPLVKMDFRRSAVDKKEQTYESKTQTA